MPYSDAVRANYLPSLARALDDRWTAHTSIALGASETEELWLLFAEAMAHLKTESPVRQVLSHDQFTAICQDIRVIKNVVRDREAHDGAAGLSIVSNDLEAVPEPSPDYYARRWPEHHANGRIWYLSYVVVARAYAGTSVVAALMRQILDLVDERGGLVALDFSEVNDAAHGLSRTIPKLSRSLGRPTVPVRLDAQVFWAYEFSAGDGSDLIR